MKKLLLTVIGILILSSQLTVSDRAFAQSPAMLPFEEGMMLRPPPPPAKREITVLGTHKEMVSPDQAVLTMSLVSRDEDVSVAKKHNDALVERMINIARNFNIAKEHLSTSSIYITPEYNHRKRTDDGKPEMIGYLVRRQLRVIMEDMDANEHLLSAIVKAKIDTINGVQFRLSNPEKYAIAFRVKAFANAKAKADALAKAAGAKLGRAMVISTDSHNVHVPSPQPRMAMASLGAENISSSVPTMPGMVELKETVTVTFEMTDNE